MTMTGVSQLAETSSRVEVRFGTTQPQRRWTVLIRIILVIPQFFVLFFVGIGALVVAFLGWFAALFTGRLPASFAKFLLGYVRWSTRVTAYEFLLTDAYPPFALDPDPNYPVDVTVTTGRLNRFAVFFRIILVVPAAIVSGAITYGMQVFAFITWIITLVSGRMPDPVFGASAATIRWQARTYAYFWMLTSYYPNDLLGDKDYLGKRMEVTTSGTVVSPPPPPTPPPAPTAYTPYAPFGGPAPTPAWGPDQPTVGAPVTPPAVPYGAPTTAPPMAPPPPPRRSRAGTRARCRARRRAGGAPPPPRAPTSSGRRAQGRARRGRHLHRHLRVRCRRCRCRASTRPRRPLRPYAPMPPPPPAAPYPVTGYAPQSLWPLALAKGARVMAVVFIVLGAVVSVGFNSLNVGGGFGPLKGFDRAIARFEVGVAHDGLTSATDTFRTSTQQCGSEPDPIQCLDQAASTLAGAFQAYGDALSRVNYPDSATAQAQAAESAAPGGRLGGERSRPLSGRRRPTARRHRAQRSRVRSRPWTTPTARSTRPSGADAAGTTSPPGRGATGTPRGVRTGAVAVPTCRTICGHGPDPTDARQGTRDHGAVLDHEAPDHRHGGVHLGLSGQRGQPRGGRGGGHARPPRCRHLPDPPGPLHPLDLLAGRPPGGDRGHHGGRRAPQAVRGPLRRLVDLLRASVLAAAFLAWHRVEGTLSIHSIDTMRRELFYWVAVMATFAMGTALGDYTASTLGLGYPASAFFFAGSDPDPGGRLPLAPDERGAGLLVRLRPHEAARRIDRRLAGQAEGPERRRAR